MWTPGLTLRSIRDTAIMDALKYFNGNRTWAAKALGISPRTMRTHVKKLKLHKLFPRDFRAGHKDDE